MRQDGRIIGLDEWLLTPAGRYLLAWEREQVDRTVVDLFGFHAVQLGWPCLDALRHNRMPHRWVMLDRPPAGGHTGPQTPPPAPPPEGGGPSCAPPPTPHAVVADFHALPFETQSLDLVVLPHSLELAGDPHQTLREVERVLVPEGKVLILGFNPASLWGLQQRCARIGMRLGLGAPPLPETGEFIGYWRLRDWLRLLNFEIEGGRFGCYRPLLRTQSWLDRYRWMEPAGDRWWPVLGAVYFLVAAKRVRGMRLIGPAWKQRQRAKSAPAVVARRDPHPPSNGSGPRSS
ncbi:class I SAM-dependent methyltransferase [Caldimonas sp.]|uniref:class I SAM-dependent methyltransferase n=1 Tax=Caldimonas sp. TaxID=2838790 RepID=UPI00391A868E